MFIFGLYTGTLIGVVTGYILACVMIASKKGDK